MSEKFYNMWAEAIDKNGRKHVVTVVGKLEKTKVDDYQSCESETVDEDGKTHQGITIFNDRRKVRIFSIARAVCAPCDNFDEETGVTLCKRRIEKGQIVGELSSFNATMLNEDMCKAILVNELKYAINNIDDVVAYMERNNHC